MWALGPYGDALRAAVLAGKLRGQAAALHALGRRLGAAVKSAGIGADLVTWVAARPARGLPRDHAEQVATGVAAGLEVPLVGLLAPAPGRDLGRSRRDAGRERSGPGAGHPGGLAGGAGAVRPPPRARSRLAGGRVLVVDDVATTGRTLAGAAGVLRQAGARAVEVAVLAAAGTAFGPPGQPAPPSGRRALPSGQPSSSTAGRGSARAPPAGPPNPSSRVLGHTSPGGAVEGGTGPELAGDDRPCQRRPLPSRANFAGQSRCGHGCEGRIVWLTHLSMCRIGHRERRRADEEATRASRRSAGRADARLSWRPRGVRG